MSPLVAYHATARRHRESISERGLIAGAPLYQPDRWGVYVYSEDLTHPVYSRSQFAVWWGADTQGPYGSDLWRVSYIGPMSHDRYVMNGMVLHQSVPPEHLTLITPDD